MKDKEILEKFLKQFDKEYQFLYEHDYVAGQDEALNWFDNDLKYDKSAIKFLNEFVDFRQDLIISDREATAFAFAYFEVFY